MLHTTPRFFSQCLLSSGYKSQPHCWGKGCWDGPLVSWIYYNVFLKAAAPGTTVGLGLFFKEQDEKHKCSTMSWSSDGIDTAPIHSAFFFPVLSTISQKIIVEKKDFTNIIGCSETISRSSWTAHGDLKKIQALLRAMMLVRGKDFIPAPFVNYFF